MGPAWHGSRSLQGPKTIQICKKNIQTQGKKDGFFMECGALDGEQLSNSLLFEIQFGWLVSHISSYLNLDGQFSILAIYAKMLVYSGTIFKDSHSATVSQLKKNIARLANAVQCCNKLSDNKDCHEFRFSIVRIVISVSNVTSEFW